MPNRILRDWTDSEPVNALSVHAERLFVRLIMKADDYGRYTANPKLLRAMLFPLTFEQVREADMSRWLAECEAAGLIALYGTEAKPLLEIINFNQRTRSPSKFASPNSVDGQMSASGGHLLAYAETHSEANAKADAETVNRVRAWFEEFCKAYPKKAGREDAWNEYLRINPDESLHRRILAAVAERAKSADWLDQHGRFVPRAAVWLRDERWNEVRLPNAPGKPKPPSKAVVEDRLKRGLEVLPDVLSLYPDLAKKYGRAS